MLEGPLWQFLFFVMASCVAWLWQTSRYVLPGGAALAEVWITSINQTSSPHPDVGEMAENAENVQEPQNHGNDYNGV